MRRTKRLRGSGGVWRSSYIVLGYRPGGLGGSGSRGIRAGSHGSGGRGLGGSGSLTGPGSFLSGGSPIVPPCRSAAHFGNSRSDQLLDEAHRYWFRERQPDRPLRHFVSLQGGGQLPPDRTSHRIQTAMVLERRIPDERPPVESKRRNAVAEGLLGAGRRGTNGGANPLQGSSRVGWRRPEVGLQLLFCRCERRHQSRSSGNVSSIVAPEGSAYQRSGSDAFS